MSSDNDLGVPSGQVNCTVLASKGVCSLLVCFGGSLPRVNLFPVVSKLAGVAASFGYWATHVGMFLSLDINFSIPAIDPESLDDIVGLYRHVEAGCMSVGRL